MGKPAFDPSQPFETMDLPSGQEQGQKPKFDPAQPFSQTPPEGQRSSIFPPFAKVKSGVDSQLSPEHINELGLGLMTPGAAVGAGKLLTGAWEKIPDVAKTAIKYGLEHMGVPVRGIELGTGILKGAKGLLGKEAEQEVEQAAESAAAKPKIDPFRVRRNSEDTGPATPPSPPAKTKIDPFRVRKNNDDK